MNGRGEVAGPPVGKTSMIGRGNAAGPPVGTLARSIEEKRIEAMRNSLRGRPYQYPMLHPHVAVELNARWRRPCEDMFDYLAEVYPLQLIDLLGSGCLTDAHLTFAAEIAGRVKSTELVKAVLIPLLRHSNPVVREGSIYGLACHLADDEVRERLLLLEREDPDDEIRSIAAEATSRI